MFDYLLSTVSAVGNEIYSPLGNKFLNFNDVFGFITNVIIGVGWGLVFIYLAMGFIGYVLSKGEKTATKNAQDQLTYAIIGGIGLFSLMLVKNLVFRLLGLENEESNENISI